MKITNLFEDEVQTKWRYLTSYGKQTFKGQDFPKSIEHYFYKD